MWVLIATESWRLAICQISMCRKTTTMTMRRTVDRWHADLSWLSLWWKSEKILFVVRILCSLFGGARTRGCKTGGSASYNRSTLFPTGRLRGGISLWASSLVGPPSCWISLLDLARFCFFFFSFEANISWYCFKWPKQWPSHAHRSLESDSNLSQMSSMDVRSCSKRDLTFWACLCSCRGFLGVWRIQDDCELLDRLPGPGGVGVRSWISSLLITRSEWYGLVPVAIKLLWMFWDVKALFLAVGYASKRSAFWIVLNPSRIRCSITPPYDRFRIAKTLTSKGCKRCDEWGGIQRETVLFSIQSRSNPGVRWLPWPSRISEAWVTFLRTHDRDEQFCNPSKFNLISCSAIWACIKSSVIWKPIKPSFLNVLAL